ncbi:MAG: PilZ domain-containing protein [Candidatus Sulfotelmatobacter sp.]
MDSFNTRRWPRYHVRLPVHIAAKTESGPTDIVVPGLVSEVSRSGMELYGGVDLHPGDVMEVEFQTPGGMRVAGVVRNRSGFCFGLEFSSMEAELDPARDALEALILHRHEAYLRQVQHKINQALQMSLEMRKFREEIEIFAKDDVPDR